MRRIISLLLVLVMVFVCISVSATDSITYSKVPTSGTPSKTEGEASGTFTSAKDGGLISGGSFSISEQYTRYLCLYANTVTYSICDEVEYTIILQKWDGFSWINQSPAYSDTDYNDNYVYGYHYKSVSAGYYRISTVHRAEEGIETDTKYATSDYIEVD